MMCQNPKTCGSNVAIPEILVAAILVLLVVQIYTTTEVRVAFNGVVGTRLHKILHMIQSTHMGSEKFKVFIGKPKGKRPLGIPSHRWKDNIRMGLWEKVWEGVERIHLAQDRDQWPDLVNTVMDLRVA
jgi:hypothetical protein